MKSLLAACGLFALAAAGEAAVLQQDIVYASPGGLPQRLDACVPDGPGPFPAVVIVHGGGWSNGDKEDPKEVRPILEPLTAGGIAWFTVNYRLSRQARYPACVEDVEAAVQFVRAHARAYRIDPEKIALSGDSAGGHIVDMVAVRATPDHPERRLSAVVCFYGPNDLVEDSFRRNTPSPSLQALFGLPPDRLDAPTVQLLQNASPLAFVTPDLPPFLLLHGTADQSVDYPGSLIWRENLAALGVPCELITIPRGVHVMGNWDRMDPPQTAYKGQVVRWLQAVWARPPAAAPVAPGPVRPAQVAPGPVRPAQVAGLWKQARAAGPSGIELRADGSGASLAAPACALRWTLDGPAGRIHLEYPAGQGRDIPYAGSPDLAAGPRDQIRRAGVRPKVAFADWRYFPAQDVMLSSNGEIFRRAARP